MALIGSPAIDAGIVRRRRHYSTAEKRRLVAEASQPGTSVSQVARRHDINTNLLFTWRRQAREGRLGASAMQDDAPLAFVPVGVLEARAAVPEPGSPGWTIEIELPNGARVRLAGAVEPAALRQAIAAVKEAW